MKTRLLALTRHPLSLAGAAITTATALLIIALVLLNATGTEMGPYSGILAFVVLPGFFVLGLLLIPFGLWQARKIEARSKAKGETVSAFPVVDFNTPGTRRGFLIFVVATVVNLLILGTASYKGIEMSESTAFCGTTCHTVMHPEYTGWQNSPHARVACVSCHIGPGADWFVKSKLSGSWQVVSVLFNLYPRPIPTPVHNLRPARETCEQCHWPTKFVGDRLKVITHYGDDEKNTAKKTVLLVRVGGKQTGGKSQGIHWHVDPRVKVRYHGDEKRERIDTVEVTRVDGTTDTYTVAPDQALPANTGAWRTMDCVDCHNRPSHKQVPAESAIDAAIDGGSIDGTLPFVKREGLKLITASYATDEEARQKIVAGLAEFYAKEKPDVASSKKPAVDAAAKALADIYSRNVFPTMKVAWGTYPNHIGHQGTPGCFRCHDDEHKTKSGKTIGQDCSTCHAPLAMDDEDPAILKQLNP